MNQQDHAFLSEVLNSDLFGWTVFGCFIVTIVVIRSVTGIIKSTSRERSRREIAAYIAEGSMTPEQGERLMKAGSSKDA